MIRCKPKSLCSWNFFLEGDGHRASLEFNWLSEQGSIVADGAPLEVHKHGVFSGQWTLSSAGQQIATAQKASAFTRTFTIGSLEGSLVLRAASPFGRSFRVERSGRLVAFIAPVHLLTRRATIAVRDPDADFTQIAFSFWLVVSTWRRAANNSNS
ncbi:hypothetical protein Pla175_04420 [Pirellulimonas nuda]|uniref:Uncharacterized protein n=1 Tax=Pirellulimonas nuda TaxID=2528009 RepID=A0A518D6I5_9BACT|nr:hypothetical protein [Pirellulimonas nuda]QDU87087.1 hypothetical protein Pla175_04420 [Pirellulimonas nuda]